ncbi:MAG: hypothetical protein ABJH63_12495 [Rhizobiaceae bacterium]
MSDNQKPLRGIRPDMAGRYGWGGSRAALERRKWLVSHYGKQKGSPEAAVREIMAEIKRPNDLGRLLKQPHLDHALDAYIAIYERTHAPALRKEFRKHFRDKIDLGSLPKAQNALKLKSHDAAIINAVAMLIVDFEMQRTRNPKSNARTACDIVSEATNMSPENVDIIWRKYDT